MGSEGDQSWDADKITDALKRLDELHAQMRNLRDVIPRTIDPLVQKHPSPEAMFQAFSTAVNEAQADMTSFASSVKDQDAQTLFSHAAHLTATAQSSN